MHIRKYDFDYSRRVFMEKVAAGSGTAGVLGALWPIMAQTGDTYKAYPEELTDIEAYTKGKVKVGDVIDKDNVELVQDLIDPMLYQEITQDGRKFFILPTQTKIEEQFPPFYLDATLKNWGQAQFGADGNVWTKDGKPGIGGHPFPNATTGEEVIANVTLAWGRHDADIYAIPTYALDTEGEVQYEYHFVWAQQQTIGLVHPDNMATGPYLPGKEHMLRYQSVWFTAPNDIKGTAFMNEWYYDQTKFPELYGYLPAFKRVRRFPTNQRFEPLVAGINLFLSDAWAAGDPMLTWGNWKIIHRGPYLGAMHHNWRPDQENWTHPVHAGPAGKSYYYVGKSLLPDVIVLEGEPTGFPRAPLSKRRVYFDARNLMYPQAISYDRRGEIWKSFEPGFAYYDTAHNQSNYPGMPDYGTHVTKASDGRSEWSWNWVISNDIQSKRITRFCQSETCQGGWKSGYDNQGSAQDFIDKYMTQSAMRRLGT
jgi:hypothetical protein